MSVRTARARYGSSEGEEPRGGIWCAPRVQDNVRVSGVELPVALDAHRLERLDPPRLEPGRLAGALERRVGTDPGEHRLRVTRIRVLVLEYPENDSVLSILANVRFTAAENVVLVVC